MLNYFFISGIAFFILAFVFSGLSKIRRVKMELLHPRGPENLKYIRNFFLFSLLTIILVFIISLTLFYPEVGEYTLSFDALNRIGLKYVGLFFVKFSCIWLIVSAFEISRIFSKNDNKISIRKLERSEVITSAGHIMLNLGVFLFFPNIFTSLLLVASAYLFTTAIRHSRNHDQAL